MLWIWLSSYYILIREDNRIIVPCQADTYNCFLLFIWDKSALDLTFATANVSQSSVNLRMLEYPVTLTASKQDMLLKMAI